MKNDHQSPSVPRREFLKTIGAAGAVLSMSEMASPTKVKAEPSKPNPKRKVCIFSKHLHWLDYPGMARTAAKIGFDGVDLTVRPGGHVSPENVERDLPKAVEEVKKAGLETIMITTAIAKISDPYAETILKTAGRLGIPYYRTNAIRYDLTKSIGENLINIQTQLKDLAGLNERYGIRGDYQNHSGANFGSSVWDIWFVLKEIRSDWIGCQFDIRHAVVEGANTWPLSLRALAPYIHTMDIKDFYWAKTEGKWGIEDCPLGEGMVDFKAYFSLLQKLNVSTPISMHFEYNLGLPLDESKITPADADRALSFMKKDLEFLRALL